MMDNPNMGGMLKQLRQMQKDLVKAQKELAKATVTSEVDGGAVRVTVTGDQRITALEIAPELLAAGDGDKLTRLVKQAVNQALEDSRKMAQDRLGPLSSGLNF
jgi:DNA-binding YbaB/EbfC family protein